MFSLIKAALDEQAAALKHLRRCVILRSAARKHLLQTEPASPQVHTAGSWAR